MMPKSGQFGATDGSGRRQIVIPAGGTHFNPTVIAGVTFCVRPGGDGSGVIDCDGGELNYNNTVQLDHNTSNPPGANGGLPQDPSCTASFANPGGQVSNASLESVTDPHPGVCNSPVEITENGTFAAGGMKLTENLAIRIVTEGSCPADTDPFDASAGDLSLSGTVTTGTSSATIFDVNDSTANMSPTSNNCGGTGMQQCLASVTGNPFGCSNIDASNLTIGKLGLSIPALDLTLSGLGTSDIIANLTLLCQ